MSPLAALVVLTACAPSVGFAQTLLRDLQVPSVNVSSGPGDFAAVGSRIFFLAWSPAHGTELWSMSLSGPPAGLVCDICPGPAGSAIETQGSTQANLPRIVDLRGVAYFLASEYGSNSQKGLWRSDGTAAGTYRVSDLGGVSGAQVVVAGNQLFVLAGGLWRSDGTSAGTVRIAHTLAISFPLSPVGGRVYFAGRTTAAGNEPWCSDGTDAGTYMLGDLNAGTGSSLLPGSVFAEVVGGAAFPAFTTQYGTELWHTDGTVAGTRLILDVNPGAASGATLSLGAAAGRVFFAANDGLHGTELWVTDGTGPGTNLVADIYSGGDSNPGAFGLIGNTVLFRASDAQVGYGAWRTDGTAAGTFRLVGGFSSEDMRFACGSGVALFTLVSSATGTEVWRTDGSVAGTSLLLDINPGPASSNPDHIASLPGGFFFTATGSARELWHSDGTSAGTTMTDILIDDADLFVGSRAVVGNRTFFTIGRDTYAMDLWVSDGSPSGTRPIVGMSGASAPNYMCALGDRLVYSSGNGLGSTDGTTGGSVVIPGVTGHLLTSLGAHVYFAGGTTSPLDQELWRTDGTVAGTTRVLDIYPGPSSSNPLAITFAGDRIYFTAFTPTHGRELWVSDGTASGTRMVADVRPGTQSGMRYAPMAILGDKLYFTTEVWLPEGAEPWISDGTAAGTHMLRDLSPGSAGSAPYDFTVAGNLVFFRATTPAHGSELWCTDGTAAGTRLCFDINPGPASSYPTGITASGDRVYFVANDGSHGVELWYSDGITTALAHDLRPGSATGVAVVTTPAVGVGVNRRVLFSGTDGVTGCEPWISDGTPAGTRRLADISSGYAASNPSDFQMVGDQILFLAYTPTAGTGLYGMPARQEGIANVATHGFGCPGSSGRRPIIRATGAPVVGNGAFDLRLGNARPASPSVLGIAAANITIPMGECTLYVVPLVTVTGATDAQGNATFPLPIPPAPELLGAGLWTQGFVLDPAGAFANALAFSNGLSIVIGQ